MNLGICQWSLPVAGPYGVKVAKELGFSGIQIDIGSYEDNFPLSHPLVQKGYKYYSEKYDIELLSIAVRPLDLYGTTRPKGDERKEIALLAIEKSIAAAKSLEISRVMLPNFQDGEIKTNNDFKNVVETLKWACDLAAKSNIEIATENLLSAMELKKLFREVDRKNLTLYFDTQNYFLNHRYDTASLIQDFKEYLCDEIHVKDGAENVLSGALLGEGASAFDKSSEALKKINYNGWLVLENYYHLSPLSEEGHIETLIKKDITTLKSFFNIK